MGEHDDFAAQVADSTHRDPEPTLRKLSRLTGVPIKDLRHYALVKFVSAGSEAILALGPDPLNALMEARRVEDWARVAGLLDWIAAGR